MFLLLIGSCIATIFANPIIVEPKPIEDAMFGNAVDFSQVVTSAQYKCLAGSSYYLAFIRAYYPANEGTFDSNSTINIFNANQGNVGTAVYMTPQPMSVSKSGGQQLLETYNGLARQGVMVRQIWLQVVNARQWASTLSNMRFIQSYMDQLKVLGITGGIYTNGFDWDIITNYWNGASSLPLWYSQVYGDGISHESQPNYNDFVSFGGWTTPVGKQFAQSEAVCGVSPLNRDVYTLSHTAKMELTIPSAPIIGDKVQL